MARGDISQRITLDGDAEVRRKLEQLGATGERALGQLSAAARGPSAGLGALTAPSRLAGC
jgi:hypothetical protein